MNGRHGLRLVADGDTGETSWSLGELERAIEECRDPALLDVYLSLIPATIGRSWKPQPYQVPPDTDWAIWAFLAGRYTGKSDAGSHHTNEHALGPPCDPRIPGGHRMRLVGPTHNDTVASCVNGATGLKAHNPEIILVGSKEGTLVRWPNGATARVMGAYTPEDVERFRAAGNSCFDWYEELAAWRQLGPALEQAEFGLRLGGNPRAIITSTPKNRKEIKNLRVLGKRYAEEPAAASSRFERVALTIANTRQNVYGNEDVRASLYARYAGTHLGRQELDAEIVEDLGLMFSRIWFEIVDVPAQWPLRVRYWDLAATIPSAENPDPDWTAGALMAYDPTRRPWMLPDGTTIVGGRFQLQHMVHVREGPGDVEATIRRTAEADGPQVIQVIEKDPGQAGKSQVEHYRKVLVGFPFREQSPSGSKIVRAQGASGAAQQGRISIVRGDWNLDYFDEGEAFPSPDEHDDQIDAVSGAFTVLEGTMAEASTQMPTGRITAVRG